MQKTMRLEIINPPARHRIYAIQGVTYFSTPSQIRLKNDLLEQPESKIEASA